MHCWRHKTPIIYRATTQWFAGMDDVPGCNGAQARARRCARPRCAGIEATQFYPGLGQGAPVRHDRQPARLDAVAAAAVGRADAVLRRTRRPASCIRDTLELLEHVAQQRRAGRHRGLADARRREDCSAPTPTQYGKITDTLDVWFDSGSTHQTVMGGPDGRATRARLAPAATPGFPADLYLEGSDQHRGWFHSSLLVSCMLNGVPPYKALLTHGFVVDGEGKKMSKSKGNVVAPQKVSRHAGRRDPAPVGRRDRLLGRAVDLRRDPEARRRELPPHPQHAALPARQHRRLRSGDATRCRSPSCSRSTATRSRGARRWPTRSRPTTTRYEFHLVVQRLQTYCSEDLGGFYLDVLKDRLYTTGADEPRAALGADRARADPRRAAEADGADAVVHRRGGVARSCIRTIATIFCTRGRDALPRGAGRRRAGRPSGRASSPCAPRC